MAVKFRLSDEEKEKANKLLNIMDSMSGPEEDISNRRKEEQERANKLFNELINNSSNSNYSNNEIKNQVNNINTNFAKNNPQTVSLPTASNNYKYSYRNTQNNNILPTKKDNKEASKSDIKVSSEPIKDISGITKSSDAFDDGYQFGDVSKTIGSTLTNAGASFIEGIGRIGEGASDFGTHVAAQVVDWAGNKEWANRIRKTAIEDRNKELFDNIQNGIKGNSVLGNKGTETLASMGYSTGLMAFEMNPLTSKIGTGLMFSSASAGGLNDSYSKEGVTNTQAWIRGLGQGAIETAVERASGLFGSVGSWDRSLSNAISSRISSGFGKLLVRTGVQGLAEGSEEIVSYTLNKIFDKAINKVSNGKGATFSEEWNWEELGEQIGIAFLSASLMGMGSTAYEVGQIVNNDKLNLAQAINEAGLRSDVKAQAELLNEDIENIKKQLKKNPNNTELTNELKSKYAQMNELVTNNVFLQDKTNIKEDEAQLRLQEAQDIINNAQNGQGQANNTTNLQTQQTIQQGNKTAQNQTSGQLNDILNNKELPMQSYQYEKSDNVKINNLRQDANKYFNNSEKARNYVSMLEKIITDKNIDIRLDANLKTADGRIANGSYSNGVITINPNSTRAGEFIAIHELTHAIGTKEMINMINTYRNSNTEFDTAVKGLLQNYEGTEISEEALSDISAQLFGNQEFINNIAQNNPNIFQKLYSEIKYLWHQFRGYKNQNQFVEDLYYKWTQAYKNNNSNIVKNNEILYNANERESDIYDTTRSNTKYENPRMETEDEKVNTRSEYEIRRIEEEKYYESNRKEVEQLIKDEIKIKFNFEDDVINEIYNNVDKDEITEQDIYDAFDKHREITMSEPSQQIINNIQSINKILRNTRLDISYIKGDIADWNDLRKSQLGKFRLANDGRGVDTLYKELLELFPGYFDANITNPTEQLLTLIEWRNITEEELLKPETYRLTDEDLIEIKDFILNSKEYLKSIKNIDFTRDNKLNTNTTKYSIQESENNSGSFSMQDNQGRTLTREQQEYFKDSKIKDRNGLLMTVYHGTNNDFNIFDKQYVSKNTKNAGFYGDGFYFTPDKESARQYGKSSKEVYLDIKNPFSFSELSKYNGEDYYSDYVQIKNLVELNSEWGNIPVKFNDKNTWGDIYEDVKAMLDGNKTDEEIDNLMYDKYGEISEKINDRLYNYSKRNNYKTLSQVLEENGYDGIINRETPENSTEIVAFNSNQIKNVDNTNPTDNSDIRYSQNNETWQSYLDKNLKATGTRTNLQDIKLQTPSNENVKPTNYSMQNEQNNTQNNEKAVNNNETDNREYTKKKDKTLNPAEIANFTEEDANTTPKLKQKHYAEGNKESNFYRNVTVDSKFLNKDLRQEMSKDENIRYYKGITNEETLEKAYSDLQKGGKSETLKWFNKESNDISAEDVAKGWILLKQYQDSGDYQGAIEVAKKMRNMATRIGQAEQAYNILSRLTPEGMFYYAQSELSEAYEKMAQGKSKEWIDENKSKFDLTPEETQFIKEKMESIQGIEDERTKKVVLAEIQKVISDKIPPTLSQSVKAWMRISMLFNPKTQVRNVMGNAVILPVNVTSDAFAGALDRIIARKTGVRTTGITKEGIKGYAKGFGKGLYESYDDFRRGINTRNIEGNRFEVTEGKSFKDKGLGKALNRADNMLSFMLDAGDRGFYEATFTNSINNQLVLNNTTEVTQEMIDIAINEALQRTWQDNNAYTNAVLKIRNILNFGKGYGLGDVLIPFAKTPANLTKAIVDYSPVGLTKTLAIDARKFNNSLKNGQYTAQMQHQFVQNFGKGMAGSFLYVLGYALAKAGIATGEADDDKDVKNFMKNSLGISSYSIKIGDKTFTYDWAQPVATPLAIMTNYVKYSKDNPDANALEKIWKSMNIGTEQLLQQSFMESLNTVLNGNGSTLENLSQAVLELPARAIPTFSKQIADMIDGTQRTSFEYDKPFQSAINSVKVKIPGLSKTLPASVDTLGNEIQKYGGNNNLWNVMLNPANTNKGQLSKAGEEIYNIYMQTGDTTIFPRTAPYYINSNSEKLTLSSKERSDFQKITGKYVESTLTGLLNNKDYKKLSDEKKAELINKIVSDSYAKAKYDVLKIDSKEYKNLRDTLKNVSTSSYYDYKFKTEDMKKDKEKIEVLVNANYTDKEKQTIYENYIKSEKDEKYDIIKSTGLSANNYLKYKLADSNEEFASDKKDNGTVKGKTITNSAKNKRYNYIINMKGATYTQKLILFALEYEPSSNTDKQQVINYVLTLKGKSKKEKLDILSKFKGVTIYKDGTFDY